MRILFLSHTFVGGNYVVGSHHLYKEAKKLGTFAMHVSTPLSLFHRLFKFLFPGRFFSQKNRFRDSLDTQIKVPRMIFPMNWRISKFFPGKQLKTILGENFDYVLVDQPYFLKYSKFVGDNKIVLRLTDRISDKNQIKLIERNLSSLSGIVVTAPDILNNIKSVNLPILFLPNGYEPFLESNQLDVKRIEGSAIYIGALDSRIDWNFIEEVACDPKIKKIDLFGSGAIPKMMPEKVFYNGTLDPSKFHEIATSYHYALLPYSKTEDNYARSPMKLYQYIEAGLVLLGPSFLTTLKMYQGVPIITLQEFALAKKHFYSNSDTNKNLLDKNTWELKFQILLEYLTKL